jgi:UDP-2-acetamido-3-amino-2,3-dideoxy-glucuronate N-acetyltransferase
MKTFIHSTAEVSPDCIVGEGTAIWHQAQIVGASSIGCRCTIGKGVYIGNGSDVGDDVKIQNYANLFGIRIEREAFIGPMVCSIEDPTPRSMSTAGVRKGQSDFQKMPVIVRRGASIGAGAILTPGTIVGRFALVGAGSVVSGVIPDFVLVIGNPARQCGYVCSCGQRLDIGTLKCQCGACFMLNNDTLTARSSNELQ